MLDLARSLFVRRPGALVTFLVLTGAGCFGEHTIHHDNSGSGGWAYGNGGSGNPGTGGYGGTGGTTAPTCAGTTPAFSVDWSLDRYQDPNHTPITCVAAGAATMDLDVLAIATNTAYHDTFPCTAMNGVGQTLPPGDYSVAMRLRDSAGTLLSEAIANTTYTIAAGCTTDLGPVIFDAIVTTPDQYLSLSWSIDRPPASALLSCDQAGAAKVELDAASTTFQWPCRDGQGATTTLAAGSYPVTVKLLDGQGAPLSVTPTMNVTVASQPVDLGDVLFDVQ
jgi:hypothetical protein